MARQVPLQNMLHDVWGRQEGVNDDNVDITTGVTTRFPSGVDGDQAGYEGYDRRHILVREVPRGT